MLSMRFLGRLRDFGLFVLRVGIGVAFIVHGSGKMFGGPAMWASLGEAIGVWNVHFFPVFWGFMAAFAEFAGGFLFILGFAFRPAAILLTITMAVAASMHITKGDSFSVYSHAVEMLIVFFSLIFIGPGKLSLDGE